MSLLLNTMNRRRDYADAVLAIEPDSLVAYWPLRGHGAEMLRDHAGSNHGSIVNDVTEAARYPAINGASDWHPTFNGSDDYIDVGNLSAINGSSELTVSAWVQMDTLGTSGADNGALISRNPVSDLVLLWYAYVTSGNPRTYVFNAGSIYVPSNSVTAAADSAVAGQWQHVVGVMDGATRAIYVDGDKTTHSSAVATTVPVSASAACMGVWQPIPTFDLTGSLAHIAIWTHALTDAQVDALYLQGINGL